MIIHNHRLDAARTFHDKDYFTIFHDEMRFRFKRANYRVVKGDANKNVRAPGLDKPRYICIYILKFVHTALRFAARKLKLAFLGACGK